MPLSIPASSHVAAFQAHLLPAATATPLPSGYTLRPLSSTDYSHGLLAVLAGMTVCPDPGEAAWLERFNSMIAIKDTYYPVVIEEVATSEVVAAGTVVLERKFIRNCGTVGHVEDIAVAERMQGKQLGKALIEALTGLSEGLGAYKTILDCDPKVEAFYKKCGSAEKQLVGTHDALFGRSRTLALDQLIGRFIARVEDPPVSRPKSAAALPKRSAQDARPSPSERTFHSPRVEAHLAEVLPKIQDSALRTLFNNCFPNTLDTTVFSHDKDGESWIITGDIPALWLRDSTNQILPYIPLLSSPSSPSAVKDPLHSLLFGLLRAQIACIAHHPFSNAFIPPSSIQQSGTDDYVKPPVPIRKPGQVGVWESKWEVDSLASFLDLSVRLGALGGKEVVEMKGWTKAVREVVRVCRDQQRGTDEEVAILKGETGATEREKDEVYRFQRQDRSPSETRSLGGLGEPARRCGLIKSAFRPSDDATIFAFLIPSNAYISVVLKKIATLISDIVSNSPDIDESLLKELLALEKETRELGQEVEDAIWKHGLVTVPRQDGEGSETVFAYEVDGFGGSNVSDDANLPSLLSLPWLGFVDRNNSVYQATRRLALSPRNKWFYKGSVGEGIGGTHIGPDMIWPMSIAMRGLTSNDDGEIAECLKTLRRSTAGTGFMHESFHKDNPSEYTRSWFAWSNSLFAQFVQHLLDTGREDPLA